MEKVSLWFYAALSLWFSAVAYISYLHYKERGVFDSSLIDGTAGTNNSQENKEENTENNTK